MFAADYPPMGGIMPMCSKWGKNLSRAFPSNKIAEMISEDSISAACVETLPERKQERVKKELEELGFEYPKKSEE